MHSVYLNNFRGFEDTFLYLQDVNFFLGENSTGKTSVLKIIKIISNPSFKIKYDLGEDFLEIGTHYDVVYRNGANLNFEVGYQKNESFINIELKPSGNKSVINKLYILMQGISIQFQFEPKQVLFKYIAEKDKGLLFADWIHQIKMGKFELDGVKDGSSHFFEELPMSTNMFMLAEKIFSRHKSENDSKSELSGVYSTILQTFDSGLLSKLTWIDPIRAEPKRLYDEYSSTYTSTGGHAPYLLKEILTSKSKGNNLRIKEFLKYGEASGLFVEIIPKIFNKRDVSSPFELLIMLGKKAIKMNHVGYGVSQVLPLIVEIMIKNKDSWIVIQQPEVHLHPKAQAAFGDFVYAFANMDDKNFIIETHSDFMIDRFRMAVNKANSPRKKAKMQAQVCFFERNNIGNQVTHIPILRNGAYGDEQPSSFREFFLKEQLELFSL